MHRPRKRLFSVLALLVVSAMVLVACGDDDDGATQLRGREISIAFVGAKTGDNANLGLNIRDGAKLAIDEENARGGDITIRLKEFDTAGDPAQANTIKDQFLGDQSIVAVIGPAFSGETKALLPSLQDAGLVMISASATNKDLPTVVPNQTVFHRALADDALQARGMAEFLATVEKPTNVAYVHDNTEYGKGLTVDVQKEASAKGIRTFGNIETVDPKSQDFSATINKVKDANLVFYGGYYNEAGRFKKQLTDAQSKAKFLSGDGALDAGFINAAGPPAAEGARLTCPYCNMALETSTGKLKEFFDNYKSKIGREPGLYSPEAYDIAKIFSQAIKAGNDSRQKMLRYVEEEFKTYDGISKALAFEPNGNLRAEKFFVFQVKDGKIAPLQELTLPTEGAGTTSTTARGSGSATTSTTGRSTTSSSTTSSSTTSSSTTSTTSGM